MISVTILVKNAEATLSETLCSVASFPEVIVLDTGSTDQTVQIAKKFANVKVFHSAFQGFGPTHNIASAIATHDFILSLDSDEVLSSSLIEEIHQLTLDPGCVYKINRHNYFRKKRIKGCSGWHPDRVIRLYHRKSTSFDLSEVHEKVIVGPLRIVTLTHPMIHTPYRTIADFLAKMQTYTTLFAEQNKGKKTSSITKAVSHAFITFIKSYFLKKGFLCGFEGFYLSLYNAHTAFYKYVKLLEANQTLL